jgi:hypothetical protein
VRAGPSKRPTAAHGAPLTDQSDTLPSPRAWSDARYAPRSARSGPGPAGVGPACARLSHSARKPLVNARRCLDRPHPLAADTPSPAQQVLKRGAPGPHRPIREDLARRPIQSGGGVRGLVRVRRDHDHLLRPFGWDSGERISGRHISVAAQPRSYQDRPKIHGQRRATQQVGSCRKSSRCPGVGHGR